MSWTLIHKTSLSGALVVFMLSISPLVVLNAQQGQQKRIQKRERVQRKVRMQVDYYNINNEDYRVRAIVKTKEGRSYVKVKDAKVSFSVIADDSDFGANLGEEVSDKYGVAEMTGKISDLPESGLISFKAAIAESEDFKKYARSVEVNNAAMDVNYVTEDSTYKIKVHCTNRDSSGKVAPIDGLHIKVYVERLFGELPISTEFNTTDESGESEIVFPQDIRGDTAGDIVIVVAVIENDDYGNLVNKKKIAWGIPLQPNNHERERLLWASKYNAPIPLVIIINGVLAAVWGMILYIVVGMIKMSRLGKAERSGA